MSAESNWPYEVMHSLTIRAANFKTSVGHLGTYMLLQRQTLKQQTASMF